MSNFTQKYALVQFIDEVDVGYEYISDNWPLHVTVVDTFGTNWSVRQMVDELSEALGACEPAVSKAGDDHFFEENGQTQVVLLEATTGLLNIHQAAIATLARGDLVLNDPQYALAGFLPHATVQQRARLHKGDRVDFRELSLVDMFPDEDPFRRKVLAKIRLATSQVR